VSNPVVFPGAVPADGSYLGTAEEAGLRGIVPVGANVDWHDGFVLSHAHSVESFTGVPAPSWAEEVSAETSPGKRTRK
jgi:hypothetical protein